ncbi:MAG: ATP-binding cassette domain-containing protein, partial [Alphaproteobacteria bacterium]
VSRRELWQIVTELVAEGIGVLWSTAYLDEAERCPEVLLLHEGRLLRRGDPMAMSARLAGRTFLVTVPPAQKRGALARLRGDDGVLDALIQGRHIRVLLAAGAGVTVIEALLGEAAREAEIRPVEPRLEDAFVAVLKETGESPGAPAAQAGKPKPTPAEPVSAAPIRPGGIGRAPQDHGATIEVHDLVRTFGPFRAVDGIGFEVARGEIFGLLGPNGAGKSTTFKMLLGLLAPSAGTARVMGIDLARASAVARGRIGYMPQKFSLYGNLGVAQNLSFFADAYGLWGRRKRARMDWVLDEFALAPVADAVSGTLPLGFKQRLSLGCALMHEPDVLFLDEPTSGVDPLIRREFWDRINAMAQTGVTIMVTTHFMDEAEYCDRVGIVYRGRLVATGSPDELKERQAEATGEEPTLEDVFVRLIEASDREMPP